jgi:hypothetical protein
VFIVEVYVNSALETLHRVDFGTVFEVSEICAASTLVPEDGSRICLRSVGITIHIHTVLFYVTTTSAFKYNIRILWSPL